MRFLIVSKTENEAASLAAKAGLQGSDVAFWAIESKAASAIDEIAKADAVITAIGAEPVVIDKPDSAGFPFEGAKAELINNTIGFMRVAGLFDTFAEAYKLSGSKAPVINAADLSEYAVGYLFKKHHIISYGALSQAKGLLKCLLMRIPINGISEEMLRYKAAGVGDIIWMYELTDKNGKDMYPLFRVGAGEESLALRRVDLLKDPAKAMKLFGYYHSLNAPVQTTAELVADIAAVMTGESPSSLYLATINKDKGYVYGVDEPMPVAVNCVIDGANITPQKADLPLPCVLASNDYVGAFLTAVNAIAVKCKTQFRRAIKLDPYVYSLLALDEADILSDSVFANNIVSAYFGGK
ncbi:MAG: hypothetical protein GX095_04610 [Clostridiales bacterium]|nr:hypothetical protein [Clostridiales bacterium]